MTTDKFIPELWSSIVLETFKNNMRGIFRPKRSKGAQLLRNAALGYDETDPGAVLARKINADILKALAND